eukprot:CAMPEP_0117661468 /NCGR_PEP_ID=MMETSP0804-20121206/7552_1 /TAXON_ID=1074897 /ORGANISM="Tetraselmis astigmatica, Strain CCMP880" /LENGTH=278 /DNA_ID=CAMNT_0005468335 /DNA_START=620 /DNA_END=1456 /DNA_ORIENTATION=-
MLQWAGEMPWIGTAVQKAMVNAAAPVTATIFGKSGEHLFMQDKDGGGGRPIVESLTYDDEQAGCFLSGLKAFATRTAYANVSGDHVVGWANSSLRFQYQLPPAEVFLDQNIREADSDDPSVVLPNTGSTPDRQQIGPFMRHPASLPTPSRPASDAELDKQVQRRMKHSRSCAARLASAPPLRSSPSRVRPYINTTVSSMLLRLQAMSWRRIDVSYARHPSFFMAHNHIQVTRKWLNKAGIPTVEHLVHLLGEMEAGLQAGIASPSSVPGQQHNQQEEA